MLSCWLPSRLLASFKVLTFDEDNRVRDRLSYPVDVDPQGRYTFDILDEANTTLPIPLLVSGA
jgi:aspartate 1-decarboxylase